jgi:hypothetical protein
MVSVGLLIGREILLSTDFTRNFNQNKRFPRQKVSEDQLEGINSAVLDGENLRKNRFVKSTVEQGFYFSMASMRLDQNQLLILLIYYK